MPHSDGHRLVCRKTNMAAASCSIVIVSLQKKRVVSPSLVQQLKAVKNEKEIAGMVDANVSLVSISLMTLKIRPCKQIINC